jgi:hypothetical protein
MIHTLVEKTGIRRKTKKTSYNTRRLEYITMNFPVKPIIVFEKAMNIQPDTINYMRKTMDVPEETINTRVKTTNPGLQTMDAPELAVHICEATMHQRLYAGNVR